MRSIAFAVVVAVAFIYACSSDIDMFPIATQGNSPAAGPAQPGSPTSPDAQQRDASNNGGHPGFDALPTEFDAGMPFDVGSPAFDAL